MLQSSLLLRAGGGGPPGWGADGASLVPRQALVSGGSLHDTSALVGQHERAARAADYTAST